MGRFAGKSARTAVTAILSLVTAALSGCLGEYQLFAVTTMSGPIGWDEYLNPRPAETPVEVAVIKVAETGKDTTVADHDVVFIANQSTRSQTVHCIDVVRKGDWPHGEKEVTRYRVIDGMITAVSRTTTEIFVDADLERTVLRAAANVASVPGQVLVYRKGDVLLSVSGRRIDACNAEVRIYKGDTMSGAQIGSKRVSDCFYR